VAGVRPTELDGTLAGVQVPQLRSPLARAVVPVVAGIVFFALLGVVLWGIALWMSRNAEDVRLGDPRFDVGRVDRVAASIEENGPLLYPDLKDPSGDRSIVIDHEGGTSLAGWNVYRLVPADGDGDGEVCLGEQVEQTRQFRDCDGRLIDVTQLAGADDVTVLIEDQRNLVLVFEGAVAAATVTGR
jgi:hypothetical protein